MARTPSKITKRDIDKDLYLEIVNEASNETNIQKLLDEYVRKDEGISEWQLPTKYRQNLTKRLNDIDTEVQGIKGDKTQQTWNDDILKRVQTLEKKEGLAPNEDGDVTPVIGTQVAANTTNISKNAKQLKILQGQLDEITQKHDADKLTLQTEDKKIQDSVASQLKTANDRMKAIETSISGKRDRVELIKEDDLDESVKKNIRAVLNIGDSTIEALDNFDSIIKRIDNVEQQMTTSTAAIADATNSFESTKKSIQEDFSSQISAARTTEQNDVSSLQTNLDTYKSDNDAKVAQLTDQVTLMGTKVTSREYRIDTINDKVESIAVDQKNNAVNIAGCEDRIQELSTSVNLQKLSLEATYRQLNQSINNAQKYPQLAKGKLLMVSDEGGSIMGTDLVFMTYAAYGDNTVKGYLKNRYSPIYDVNNDRVYVDLTIGTEGSSSSSESASGSTDSGAGTNAGTEAGSGTDSGTTTLDVTPGTESGGDAASALETSLVEDVAGAGSSDTPSSDGTEAAAAETPAEGNSKESAPSEEGTKDAGSGDAPKDDSSSSDDTKPADDAGTTTPSDKSDASNSDGSKTEDGKGTTGDSDSGSTSEEDEAAKELAELSKNYQVIENYAATPENFNTLLIDKYHHALFAYIDGSGQLHEFGAFSCSDDPREIVIQAGSCASFFRNSAAARPPIHVLVKDNNKNSSSYGKWINSEGVVTIGYDDDMYTIYNNSAALQELRIIEG